jgi:hypothetical protein
LTMSTKPGAATDVIGRWFQGSAFERVRRHARGSPIRWD